MSSFTLTPSKQVDLSAYTVNTDREAPRRKLVRKAKGFVDSVQNKDGNWVNVAYRPEKDSGVGYLTGGARIVAETLYELYLCSPVDSIHGAIRWALVKSPGLLAHDDFDLGLHRGAISQNAYALGAEYFEASMSYALDERQKAAQQRKRDQRQAQRAEGFRRVDSRGTVGEAIGPNQVVALEAAVRPQLKDSASTVKPASKAPTPRDIARRVHVHV